MILYSIYCLASGKLIGWTLNQPAGYTAAHEPWYALPTCDSADWFCCMCTERMYSGHTFIARNEYGD